MRGLVALTITISACGFSTPASNGGGGGGGGGDDGTSPDAAIDTAPDAGDAPVNLPLFAASNQMLYQLDIDAHTSTLIGPIEPPTGGPIDLDGLALYGHTLIGISDGGDQLMTIDRTNAAITSTMTLMPSNTWAGLTVIPAGDVQATALVLAGSPSDGKLYKIDPATGAVTAIGPFGGGFKFFTDLAWVHGAGLFATLQGPSCSDVCFAKIDPLTGTATAFRTNLGTNIYGMSGYRAKLWAFNNAGPVLSVNETSGVMAIEFDPQVPWTEAAQ